MLVCQPLHVAEKTLLAQHTYLQTVCPEKGQVDTLPFPLPLFLFSLSSDERG